MSRLGELGYEVENLHERMLEVEARLEELNIGEHDADKLGREVDAVRDQVIQTQRAVLALSLEVARGFQKLLGLVEQCADAIGELPQPPPEQLRITGGQALILQDAARIGRAEA